MNIFRIGRNFACRILPVFYGLSFSAFAQATTRCEIRVPRCWDQKYQGVFLDTFENAGTNQVRCLARAKEYQSYCKITQKVVANFWDYDVLLGTYSALETAPQPRFSKNTCMISVQRCANNAYQGIFPDTYSVAQTSQTECLKRAADYQLYCQTKTEVEASWVDTNRAVIAAQKAPAIPEYHCEIQLRNCPASGAGAVNFYDTIAGVTTNSDACLKRASDYQNWCATNDSVVATYLKDYSVIATNTWGAKSLAPGAIDPTPSFSPIPVSSASPRAAEVSLPVSPSEWCGLATTSFGASSVGLEKDARNTWNTASFSIPCLGTDIGAGKACPVGFHRLVIESVESASDNSDNWVTCIKDQNESSPNLGNQGALCGVSVIKSGPFQSVYVDGQDGNADVKCKNKNVYKEGCPTGYRRTYLKLRSSEYDIGSDSVYTCVKESQTMEALDSDTTGSFCGLDVLNQGSTGSAHLNFSEQVRPNNLFYAPKRYQLKCKGIDIQSQGCPSGYARLTMNARGYGTDSVPDSVSTCIKNESTPIVAGSVPGSCRAPRHYQYLTEPGQNRWLSCAANTEVFSVEIPDEGKAIVRYSAPFLNSNASQIYYWYSMAQVGEGTPSYAVGDDICPGFQTAYKTNLGYGPLTSKNHTVKIFAGQGSSPCNNGNVIAMNGGIVDVWVEDPRPECVGKDIGMVSTYEKIGQNYFGWSTNGSEILKLNVPSENAENRGHIVAIGVVEGSPATNPNTSCGSEAASLSSYLSVATKGNVSFETGVIPASSGMGHVVLHNFGTVNYDSSVSSVSYWVTSNTGLTTVTTGGCCGDAKVGFIKLP